MTETVCPVVSAAQAYRLLHLTGSFTMEQVLDGGASRTIPGGWLYLLSQQSLQSLQLYGSTNGYGFKVLIPLIAR